MRKIAGVSLVALALIASAFADAASDHGASHAVTDPDKIEWKPFVGPFTWAVLSGDPMKKGSPFVIRIKHPDGVKVPPHWHPIDEHATVISGQFRMGMGKTFDESKMEVLPPGAYMIVPKTVPHYAVGEGETIVQVHGVGPFTTKFVNPADDPTAQKPPAKK